MLFKGTDVGVDSSGVSSCCVRELDTLSVFLLSIQLDSEYQVSEPLFWVCSGLHALQKCGIYN